MSSWPQRCRRSSAIPRPSASSRVIVITGPTAVGKSEVAFEVAQALDAEIISADSRQVYHYMNIGTAKPTLAERTAVPHHMVSVTYPNEPFSIAEYQWGAERSLAEILSRGKSALVVGGSPHYIQALIDRLRPAPQDPALRAWLQRADRAAPERLDRWIEALDPAAAATIDPRNRRRVIRAIEVTLATGAPFSEVGRQRGRPVPALWIGLRRDREALHQRVERRIHAMLDAGWLGEVRTLLAMGYSPRLPALTAHGYAEMTAVARGELDLEEAIRRVRFGTHALIRRQETWLRAERRVRWFDAAEGGLTARVIAAIRAFGHNPGS